MIKNVTSTHIMKCQVDTENKNNMQFLVSERHCKNYLYHNSSRSVAFYTVVCSSGLLLIQKKISGVIQLIHVEKGDAKVKRLSI